LGWRRGGVKQRLHDALVEHAAENQQTHLSVTVSVETLLGLEGAPAAEIEGMPPIAQRTVERLACDCSVRRILLDPKSNRGGDSDLPNQALVCYHHLGCCMKAGGR